MATGMFSNIKGDLFGGITAGIVALPLALAFGVQSGMGAEAGLYGAIFIGFFAALLGGTNTQISGPTAPMTAVSMTIVAGIVQANEGDLERAIPAILIVFFIAGLLQVLLGVMGLGKYIKYIPYPVVSGFMTGIGVIIIITQLLPMLGWYAADDAEYVEKFRPQAQEALLSRILQNETGEGLLVLENFQETATRGAQITKEQETLEAIALAKADASGTVGAVKNMARAFQNIDKWELLLALITIFIIYGFKKITTAIPSALVALLVVSGAAVLLDLDVRSIGDIPSGFPELRIAGVIDNFNLSDVTPYILTALTLALLGAIDSLLTSIVADNMTKTKHNSNKELIGQGVGNSIAALFGGLPGAGATIRTVVNINAGGVTRISGMTASVLLLIILLALGDIASQIPKAVLVGILITVGIGVIDYKGLRALKNMPRADAFVLILVLILTVFWNLVYAVGLGLIIASLVFMKKMADINVRSSRVGALDDEEWADDTELPEKYQEEVYIKHLSGPIFFGFSNEFTDLVMQVPETASHVILRMSRVPYMDQSGVYALEKMIDGYKNRGVQVIICGVTTQVNRLIHRMNLVPGLVPDSQVFKTFTEAIDYVEENVANEY